MFHVFTFHFFLNIVNRAEGIWSSDNYSDVRLNLKRNEMLSSLTWKTLARKNIKKQNRLVFRLKALFLLKNIFCLYFSPVVKLWPRKKVIFKVFIFSRYSKTLNLIREKPSFIKNRRVIHQVTTNDNKWQRMTTSGITSDHEWYSKWQRVVISANFPFFEQERNLPLSTLQRTL